MSIQLVFVVMAFMMVVSTFTEREKWCWRRRRIFFCWLLFWLIAVINFLFFGDQLAVTHASVAVQMFLICFVPCGVKSLNKGWRKVARTVFFLSLAVINGFGAWSIWKSGG